MLMDHLGVSILPVPDVDEQLLRLDRGDEVREAGGFDLRHLVERNTGLKGRTLQTLTSSLL